MNLNEAIAFIKAYRYPAHCSDLGCDQCIDDQLNACEKLSQATDVLSHEINELKRIVEMAGDGLMKNTEKIKAQALNRIEELKKVKVGKL